MTYKITREFLGSWSVLGVERDSAGEVVRFSLATGFDDEVEAERYLDMVQRWKGVRG